MFGPRTTPKLIAPLLLLIVCFLLAPLAAEAAPRNPGFYLHFNFKPPAASSGPMVAYLDVCQDRMCSVLQVSVPLKCTMKKQSKKLTVMRECSAHTVLWPQGPDAALMALSQPVTLRLRINKMGSLPFYFQGGTAALPNLVYRFSVVPNQMHSMTVLAGS